MKVKTLDAVGSAMYQRLLPGGVMMQWLLVPRILLLLPQWWTVHRIKRFLALQLTLLWPALGASGEPVDPGNDLVFNRLPNNALQHLLEYTTPVDQESWAQVCRASQKRLNYATDNRGMAITAPILAKRRQTIERAAFRQRHSLLSAVLITTDMIATVLIMVSIALAMICGAWWGLCHWFSPKLEIDVSTALHGLLRLSVLWNLVNDLIAIGLRVLTLQSIGKRQRERHVHGVDVRSTYDGMWSFQLPYLLSVLPAHYRPAAMTWQEWLCQDWPLHQYCVYDCRCVHCGSSAPMFTICNVGGHYGALAWILWWFWMQVWNTSARLMVMARQLDEQTVSSWMADLIEHTVTNWPWSSHAMISGTFYLVMTASLALRLWRWTSERPAADDVGLLHRRVYLDPVIVIGRQGASQPPVITAASHHVPAASST